MMGWNYEKIAIWVFCILVLLAQNAIYDRLGDVETAVYDVEAKVCGGKWDACNISGEVSIVK